jgi:hypothetical protein
MAPVMVIAAGSRRQLRIDDDDVVRRNGGCHTISFDVDAVGDEKTVVGVEDARRVSL